MVRNIGEGHLLPEMKDTVTKVQNLVTETDGEAWATAFAEVSLSTDSSLPCLSDSADITYGTTINFAVFEDGFRTTRHIGIVGASSSVLC